MTSNQLEFAKIQETGRHNRVQEKHEHRDVESRARTARASELQAQSSWFSAQEAKRHNVEQEAVNWFTGREQISELQRHNRATESLSKWQTEIDQQYKRDYIGVQQRNATVAERTATVAERNASTNWINALTSSRQADISKQVADTREGELRETMRHNKLSESLASGQLAESVRHNVAQEGLVAQQNQTAARNALTSWANLLETRKQTGISSRQTDIRQQEADISGTRAKSYADEVSTKQLMVELQQAELEKEWYDARTRRGSAIVGGVRDISSALNNTARALTTIGGIYNAKK